MSEGSEEAETSTVETILTNPFENMRDGYWYILLTISHILFLMIPIFAVVFIIYTDYGSIEAIVRGWPGAADSWESAGSDAKLVIYPLVFGIVAGIGSVLFYTSIVRLYFRKNEYPSSEDISIPTIIPKIIVFTIIGAPVVGFFGYIAFGIAGAVVGVPLVSLLGVPAQLVIFGSLTIGFVTLGYYLGHFSTLGRGSPWRETDRAMQEVERARNRAASADKKFKRGDLRDAVTDITAAKSYLKSARDQSDNTAVEGEIEKIEASLQSNTERIENELVEKELEAIYREL